MRRLAERRTDFSQKRRRDDGGLGPAVAQEIDVIGGPHERVGRDGDGADLDGAPERPQELRGVQTAHPHPVLRDHAEVEQRVARAVGEIEDVGVGEDPVSVEEGRPSPSTLRNVAIDEVGRNVELLRQRLRRVHFDPLINLEPLAPRLLQQGPGGTA
jgi:hypothetical protein